MHACFRRGAVGFAGVTGNAGADNVFPSGWSSPVTWNNMIKVKQFSLKNFAAVLALVSIPLKDVVAREFDFFLREPVIHQQQNDFGYPDFE
jgi:hypothetical protein